MQVLMLPLFEIYPTEPDIEFINWLGKNNLPFIRLFSKSDKVKKGNIQNYIREHNTQLKKFWKIIPDYIISSSKDKIGKIDILNKIFISQQKTYQI